MGPAMTTTQFTTIVKDRDLIKQQKKCEHCKKVGKKLDYAKLISVKVGSGKYMYLCDVCTPKLKAK